MEASAALRLSRESPLSTAVKTCSSGFGSFSADRPSASSYHCHSLRAPYLSYLLDLFLLRNAKCLSFISRRRSLILFALSKLEQSLLKNAVSVDVNAALLSHTSKRVFQFVRHIVFDSEKLSLVEYSV